MGMSQYSNSHFDESESIKILTEVLEDNKTIATHFSKNDKTPNHDGFFELLKNKIPYKKFIVQIKKVENLEKEREGKHRDKYVYKLKTNFLDYVYNHISTDPAIYFIVDIKTQKVFWLYLSKETLENLDFFNKETVTYAFEEKQIITDLSLFEKELFKIANEINKKHSQKPQNEIIELQKAIDHMNNILIDGDLNFITKTFFPDSNIRKFGIASSPNLGCQIAFLTSEGVKKLDFNTNSSFGIYPIKYGEQNLDFQEFVSYNQNYFEYFRINNNLTPIEYVQKLIEDMLDLYFNKHYCINIMPDIALKEILLNFVEKFEIETKLILDNNDYKKSIKSIENALNTCINYSYYLSTNKNCLTTEKEIQKVILTQLNNNEKFDILNLLWLNKEPFLELYKNSNQINADIKHLKLLEPQYTICFYILNKLKKKNIQYIEKIWDFDFVDTADINVVIPICQKWFNILEKEYLNLYNSVFLNNKYFISGNFKYAFANYHNDILKEIPVCIKKWESSNFCFEMIEKDAEVFYKENKNVNGSFGFLFGKFLRNKQMIYDSLRCLLYQGICKNLNIDIKGINFCQLNNIFGYK